MASHPSFIDEGGGRKTWSEGDAHDTAAARFNDIPADDVVLSPIRAFDEDVGPDECHDRVRRVLIKHDHRVDALEREQDFSALSLWGDRPVGAFDRPDRPVGVDGDNESVAQRASFAQVTNMARVEQVKDPVSKDEAAAPGAHALRKRGGLA
jgi:hypothetical protein